jgi:hypothetical protein
MWGGVVIHGVVCLSVPRRTLKYAQLVPASWLTGAEGPITTPALRPWAKPYATPARQAEPESELQRLVDGTPSARF